VPAVLAALTVLRLLGAACGSTVQVGRGGGVELVDGGGFGDGDAGIADESLALGEQGFGIGEDEMSLPPTTDGTGEGGLGGTASEPGGAGNEALGAGGLSTGDMRRQRDAVLAHHNERGGAAGRRIEAPAIVGTTRLGPERQPGIDRYRLGAFVERCTCFQCTSDWRAAR
jgi:hypothetical protein